jgi:hypothetical protein
MHSMYPMILLSMKIGSSIIFSKNLKIWKLHVTNKIALVKDEDSPFKNQIP